MGDGLRGRGSKGSDRLETRRQQHAQDGSQAVEYDGITGAMHSNDGDEDDGMISQCR